MGRNPGEAGWARLYPLDGNYDDRSALDCGRAPGRWDARAERFVPIALHAPRAYPLLMESKAGSKFLFFVRFYRKTASHFSGRTLATTRGAGAKNAPLLD